MFIVGASLAALVHLYIFALESLMWGSKRTNRVFGVTAEQAEASRLFAFNQGFYNLFLAIAALIGIVGAFAEWGIAARSIALFACVSMVGAALVLVASQRRLWRAALIQGLAPTIAVIGGVLSI